MRPENLANLQTQLDFIEQISPMIAKLPSITAQDAYIRKLVEILPDFEYNQVEQAVNLRRENMKITDHPVSNLDASSLTESFTDENDYSSLESVMPVDFEEAYYENNVKTQQTYRRSESAQVVQPSVQVPKLSRSEKAEEILDSSINVIKIYLIKSCLKQWFMNKLMNHT